VKAVLERTRRKRKKRKKKSRFRKVAVILGRKWQQKYVIVFDVI
jgi:hypothetical protein